MDGGALSAKKTDWTVLSELGATSMRRGVKRTQLFGGG